MSLGQIVVYQLAINQFKNFEAKDEFRFESTMYFNFNFDFMLISKPPKIVISF